MSAESDQIKTTDTPVRYLAYLGRVRALVAATSRYLAYTSDVGEAFRPIVHPYVVRSAYAISWLYCIGDVAYETHKSYKRDDPPKEVALVAFKRTLFQSVASMLLPSLTIHTQVHVFHKVFDRIGRFQKVGPTVAGLALVPLLPFMFDHPLEHLLDRLIPTKPAIDAHLHDQHREHKD